MLSAFEEFLDSFKFTPDDSYVLHNFTFSMPLITLSLYLLMVHKLPKYLQNSKMTWYQGTPLKIVMIVWNLFLAVVSFLMAFGIGIPYVRGILQYGIVERGICDTRREMFLSSSMSFWAHMFILSKYAELLDTFLLIVKKPERPVPFLHWYHHATVLIATWSAEYSHQPAAYIFGIINAVIHTIMYTYYALTEMGYRPNWNKLLTMAQISQMIFGILVNCLWAYIFFLVPNSNCNCKYPRYMLTIITIMYGSYLYLFLQFFFRRYKPTDKKKEE